MEPSCRLVEGCVPASCLSIGVPHLCSSIVDQGSSDGEMGIDEVISLMRDAEEGDEDADEEEEEEMESYWSDRAWDVAQRFEVLVQEAQAAPLDMFASIGTSGFTLPRMGESVEVADTS